MQQNTKKLDIVPKFSYKKQNRRKITPNFGRISQKIRVHLN